MRSSVVLAFSLLIVVSCTKDGDPILGKDDNVTPNSFLSSTKYDKLVVEIQYMDTYQATTAAINNLKTFLQQRLSKSAGITYVEKAIPSGGKTSYSASDIRTIEKANRSQHTNGSTLTAYFLFTDGDYSANSGNSKVLGIAYESSSMAVFEKTIRDYSGGLGQPAVSTLESTVILHEFGHILGLVNNGTSMVAAHQDVAHGKHCDDQNCLMYYTAETSDIVANLTGGTIPSLNAKCLDDLKANGGK